MSDELNGLLVLTLTTQGGRTKYEFYNFFFNISYLQD